MSARPARCALLIAITLAACLCPAESRAERRKGFELGILGGLLVPDDDLTGTSDPDFEPTLGGWIGGDLFGRWAWFADAQYAEIGTKTFAGDAEMLAGRAGAEFQVSRDKKFEPFYSGSFGYTYMTFDNATDFTSAFVSVGIGEHVAVGRATRLRWEVRLDHTLARDGLRGEDLTQVQALVGFNWAIGRGSQDADGDGVRGGRDHCPDTPPGASVDGHGCMLDADSDGVHDGLDRCAGTPESAPVDDRGCPFDSDGDRVPDWQDACPATPSGVAVDRRGCPPDRDGDGVADPLDDCPNTIKGIEVDERGCFLDRDRDGVYDGLGQDKCPDTPRGAEVDVHGCPLDGDGDGVYDGLDRCPDTPPGTAVGEDGCPTD